MGNQVYGLRQVEASPAARKGVHTKVINNYRRTIEICEHNLSRMIPNRDRNIELRVAAGWFDRETVTKHVDDEIADMHKDIEFSKRKIAEAEAARAAIS